jgi:serine/threonine protein kinase
MKKPKGLLSVNIDLINCENQASFQLDDTTFRQNGLSIGRDYLRMEGQTITRGELQSCVLTDRQVIGTGAFSTVYSALWNKPGDSCDKQSDQLFSSSKTIAIPVAVKELRIIDASPQRRKMLLHELKALSRVTSPALVQLYGAFLEGDIATMVLELMDRGSLDAFIQQQQTLSLSEEQIAPVSYQALVGLSALHKHRMLHRDFKPGNVVLCHTGAVKLCDFGMASLGEHSLNTTVLGTTKYMAPERLSGKAYGRLSDMWSFGLLLLECATGKPPFMEISSIVDLVVHLEEMDFTRELSGCLHAGLKEIIRGSLQVIPGRSRTQQVTTSSWNDFNTLSLSDSQHCWSFRA